MLGLNKKKWFDWRNIIENRAVGTNGDIHRRKHASQGKKLKKTIFFVDKVIDV